MNKSKHTILGKTNVLKDLFCKEKTQMRIPIPFSFSGFIYTTSENIYCSRVISHGDDMVFKAYCNGLSTKIIPPYNCGDTIEVSCGQEFLVFRIINIEPQLFNDMREEDALAEGVKSHPTEVGCYVAYNGCHKDGSCRKSPHAPTAFCCSARSSFRTWWDGTYQVNSLVLNPWVWVFELELL